MFISPLGWPSPVADGLAIIVYILLAGIVTVDVLLTKSDVRGALGWIAAAWFSPIVGSLVYYMFGINRVSRRAARFGKLDNAQAKRPAPVTPATQSPGIALLAECGARITDSPLTAGNALTILEGGDQAYPAMLEAIARARHCVALTSYIFRDDEAGNAFADALIAAHARGVDVRVLLDSVGIGYFRPAILHKLRAGGVPTARFLHTWVPWRMPFLNMRNHRKLLVVDGTLGFLGGMNVGAENSQRLRPHGYIHDIHFRVQGPVVRMVMDGFARDWLFTTDERLDEDRWWPRLESAGAVFARGLGSGPDADIYKLEMILGAAFSLARKRVRIVTPYFLPDQRLQFAIAQACLRGVDVEIVLPQTGDHNYMDWAMRGHLRFFKHIPAHIYLTPGAFDHAKLCTVDGEWSLIGSSNWDARSFRLNFEYDLECYDPAFTTALDTVIDGRIGRAHRLTYAELAALPLTVRLRNAAARLVMPYL